MKTSFFRYMLAVCAAASMGWAGSALAQVDMAQSKVSAVAKQMNVPTEGVFKHFSAQIQFDPSKAAQGHASVTIDVGSYDLGDPSYNAQVTGADWFDAKTYPHATFVSSSITPIGGNRYTVAGKLTIKGKTVAVSVPVTITQSGAKQIFDGALPIKRSTFDVGSGEWKDTSIVADEVEIKFHIVAAK